MAESGYSSCKCPDCFEIAISDDISNPDFCPDCEEAGCDGEDECQCEHAYGGFEAEEDAHG